MLLYHRFLVKDDLELTIANGATDESILIQAGALALDQTVEVDTKAKTVTYHKDGSRLANPSTLEGGRTNWLRLMAGANLLTIGDVGTQELEVDVIWDRRYFE